MIEQTLDQLSEQALQALQSYFQTPVEEGGLGKRADRALTLLARRNGVMSLNLKALALKFGIARAMGLQGEPLRPLLAELGASELADRKQIGGEERK